MQPLEYDDAWNELDRTLVLTDDEVRTMGHKEYKPGYFVDDPRYPGWAVEDRYLYDHPGPDWKTKPPLAEEDRPYERGVGKAQFRAEQRIYESDGDESLQAVPRPETYNLRPEADRATIPVQATAGKFSGIWLCRSCRKQPALWPHEKAWRWKIWGVTGTIVFRSPLACTDCRVFNFRVTQALGRQDHRPFWNRVFLWQEGDGFRVAKMLLWRRIVLWLRARGWGPAW